jgi:hypothetical protein
MCSIQLKILSKIKQRFKLGIVLKKLLYNNKN